jgi:hypothetical protein
MMLLRTLLLAAACLRCTASLHVCSAGVASFVGEYTEDSLTFDGAPKFVNENGMSVYRHQGYWYFGDMAPWPPMTYYRCIEGCGYNSPAPPLTGFQPKKGVGAAPSPVLQSEPCAVNDEL